VANPSENDATRENNMTDTAASDRRLHFTDGLRGLAALWVVLFHLSEGHHIDALRAWLPHAVNTAIFDWGHGGVGVFFVLSGFVMALTVDRVRLDGVGAGRFVLRRLIRLCPPYWLAIAVSTAILAAKGMHVHAGQLLANVFFLQGIVGVENISIVFWTLCIEIQFYIAFAVMTWASDRIAPGRGTSRVAIALLALAWPLGLLAGPVWSGGFLPFWAYFMAGALAFEANKGRGTAKLIGSGFSVTLLALGLIRGDLFSGVAGLTGLGLIAAGAGPGMQRWLSARPLQLLGAVSYSLYLFHNQIVGPAYRILDKVLPHRGPCADALVGVATVGCCVAAAWCLWFTVERASIRWSHMLSTRRQPGRSAVAGQVQ
jgi:peptidoglycan/LPS O-acetylase OafA/YrhL